MTRGAPGTLTLALAVGLSVAPAVAAGQTRTVVTEGSADVALDRRLARLLEADPLVVTTDRRIAPDDTVRRSVLVLDATLIHEGVILGDLVIVDAGAFVRHESWVEGDLVNVGGGLYRSARARIGGSIVDLPRAPYRVVREEDRVVIEATATPSRWTLDGFRGLRTPSYDRVNGVTVAWGARYRLPRIANATPAVGGHVGWRTELGAPTYGGRISLRAGALTIAAGHRFGSTTRDDWAWSDVRNSVNYLWDGDDFHDHYESARSYVSAVRAFGDEAKSFYGKLRVTGQVEDASSLAGDQPWNLLGDTARTNPAVDDGRISSVVTALSLEWHGLRSDAGARVTYEAARPWQDGAFEFDRVAIEAQLAIPAVADHTLEIQGYAQLPAGDSALPMQRWTVVGGASTLYTVPPGFHRGDRAVWVESRYRIPAPRRLALPILGAPELQLRHAAGKAWTTGQDGTLVHEVAARLQFFGLYVQYALQPGDAARDDLAVGFTWPFGQRFPWEIQ